MKKAGLFFGLLLLTVVLSAWSGIRPAFNRPQSVVVEADVNNIPTTFTNAAGSQVFTDLRGKGYQHMMIYNETDGILGVLPYQVNSASLTADHETKWRVQIPTGGTATFDDFSVFQYLYLRSEDGPPLTNGTVTINVW